MTETKEKVSSSLKEILDQPYRLILENDNYNTFDWVITCLIKICGHEFEQASQCATIVHYNGKCDVKYGDRSTIEEMKNKLKDAGLSVSMEKN